MQLEFFGEQFDKAKCNQTCDNCKAGREAVRRDMTDEARTILQLLESIQKQQGALVTLSQLSQLYAGSTARTATKDLDTKRLVGFSAGKDIKKGGGIDRVTHQMMFERILEETSVENRGGFLSDYVNPGENAQNLLQGRKRLFVEFPKPGKKANKENKKPAAKKKRATASSKKKTTTATSKKKTVATSSKSKPASKEDTNAGLSFEVDGSSSDDDDDVVLFSLKGNKNGAPPTLPDKHTKALIDLIKQLTQSWANEEKLMGNKVFCK
jgi:outer membrane protein assembly factor BamE (lipoprotein component of BamABCDE complex)